MVRYNPQEVAFIETITTWWSREIEDRVKKDGWNAYLVTFMFNHVSGLPAARLKAMPAPNSSKEKAPIPSLASSIHVWGSSNDLQVRQVHEQVG